MIQVDTTVENEIATLKLKGEVDASSSIHLDTAISEAKKGGHKKIMIDARELNYISSAGLGVFMSYIKDFEKENVQFVLFGLNEKVLNVFKMLGLDQLLSIYENEEEALKVLGA
jgi:anti-sigma B factor antagonist